MPNYKQEVGTGQSWQRCYSMKVDNPLNGTPTVTFYEEAAVSLGNNIMHQPVTSCTKIFNPQDQFEELDPSTNIPTGVILTHQDLYRVLYSLYMKTAVERDTPAPSTGV